MTWQNGLDEAIARLQVHTNTFGAKYPARFDARDREALAFVLEEIDRLRLENLELRDDMQRVY